MTYKVIEIIEPDFGCEGLPDGQEPMCEVILESSDGNRISVTVPDRILYEKMINEGMNVSFNDGIIERESNGIQ